MCISRELFSDQNFWSAISAIAGALAAFAAFGTIWQSRVASEEARASLRPYFLLEGPGLKPLNPSPPYRVLIPLRNAGTHTAADLEARIYMVPTAPNAQAALDIKFSVANDIPPNSPTPWYNDSLHLPPNVPPHYVLLGIEYRDPVLDKHFVQAFFMRWNGVQNGSTEPDFVHVTKEERADLETRFKSIIGKYLPK